MSEPNAQSQMTKPTLSDADHGSSSNLREKWDDVMSFDNFRERVNRDYVNALEQQAGLSAQLGLKGCQ